MRCFDTALLLLFGVKYRKIYIVVLLVIAVWQKIHKMVVWSTH